MYFKYILLLTLTLALASNGLLNTSLSSAGLKEDCTEEQFKCGNGNCLPSKDRCDVYRDCQDGSDELNCTSCTGISAFRCGDGECISKNELCDLYDDCKDGSDENNCTNHICHHSQFRCQSGQCAGRHYEPTVVCNGKYECGEETDKSDETNCTTCSEEAWKCGSGECVHKVKLCNSMAECADGSDENEINCPHGSTPPVMSAFWRQTWSTLYPNLTLQHLTTDMAVYFHSSVSTSVTWPFSPLSQAWKYAKETFGLGTLSEPGSQFLYVILGERRPDIEYDFSFRSWQSGYRNVIDQGARDTNFWVIQNAVNFEILISSLGYIVKIGMEEVLNKADYFICESDLGNTVFYDIYIHLKGQESADVLEYKAHQFNRTLIRVGQYNCFRDWYLPVYEKYGRATVLNNYFQIFKENWPKKQSPSLNFSLFERNQLNVGELVHFWSGAAGKDLRYLAKSAFNNWDDVFMRQFAKAQTDFPDITYPVAIMTDDVIWKP